jgi:hypothetical protein
MPQTSHSSSFHPEQDVPAFQWFIALIAKLLNNVEKDRSSGSLKPENAFEIHLFVTSFDEKLKGPLQLKEQERHGSVVAGSPVEHYYGIQQVADALNNPACQSKNFTEVLASGKKANAVGDAYFWNGRPDWDQIFARVKRSKNPRVSNIGVCFCGASNIGKDLKRMTSKYTSVAENTYFTLHKENF